MGGLKTPGVEKAYEKYAWIVFFVLGILFLTEGLYFSLGPAAIPDTAKAWALQSIIGPVLLMAVSFKSYRRGEKWAWYAFWIVPAFGLAESVRFSNVATMADPIIAALVFLLISFLGLFLPYRKFFPKKPVIGAASA